MKKTNKRALFHYSILNIGGAERSLLRLMRFLCDAGWQVDLAVSTGGGALECSVDPRVRVIPLRDWVAGRRVIEAKQWVSKVFWACLCFLPYLISSLTWLFRALLLRKVHYDVAVVSLHGLSPYLCCKIVRSSNVVQWIRNDLSRCKGAAVALRRIKSYLKYIDAFACVSETVKASLVKSLPSIPSSKAKVIYNFVDQDEVSSRSSAEGNPYLEFQENLKVVTVCRMVDKAKGLFRMYRVFKRLVATGADFTWFLVGGGEDFSDLSAAVSAERNDRRFILVGPKSNPYPYFKFADLSATLSYYEGLCGTVIEAKLLGKPVIATRFAGVEEQIVHNKNGYIVENDEDSIFHGMQTLLSNAVLREQLSNSYLPEAILDNARKVQQFEDLAQSSPASLRS